MAEQKSQKLAPPPWHVPVTVAEIAEAGQHFDLVAAPAVRAAVALLADVREVTRLEATFDVTPDGKGGAHVNGHVSGTVGQNCVVTLDPLVSAIDEAVDLVFVAKQADEPEPEADDEPRKEPRNVKWDDPEPLIGGSIDLGQIATEFLILALDPYPRKPDAIFEAPQDDRPEPGPFAALAKLKGQDGP